MSFQIINHPKRSVAMLTLEGLNMAVNDFDVSRQVADVSKLFWTLVTFVRLELRVHGVDVLVQAVLVPEAFAAHAALEVAHRLVHKAEVDFQIFELKKFLSATGTIKGNLGTILQNFLLT